MAGVIGTGKTALSLRAKNCKIIGDDEICWGPKGVFNLEGGCYAKINNLVREVEPEISNSIQFGSLIENANFYRGSREINFNDTTLTEHARTSFPIKNL